MAVVVPLVAVVCMGSKLSQTAAAAPRPPFLRSASSTAPHHNTHSPQLVDSFSQPFLTIPHPATHSRTFRCILCHIFPSLLHRVIFKFVCMFLCVYLYTYVYLPMHVYYVLSKNLPEIYFFGTSITNFPFIFILHFCFFMSTFNVTFSLQNNGKDAGAQRHARPRRQTDFIRSGDVSQWSRSVGTLLQTAKKHDMVRFPLLGVDNTDTMGCYKDDASKKKQCTTL